MIAVIPPLEFVAEVRQVAEAFLAQRSSPNELIAIHCAYGERV